jgi:GcrA cell cycle regulator
MRKFLCYTDAMSIESSSQALWGVGARQKIPHAEKKTVETLLADDCRWPFGDPSSGDFHFCGKRQKDGSPYCDLHARQAFQAVKPRAVAHRPLIA